jgi:integrase
MDRPVEKKTRGATLAESIALTMPRREAAKEGGMIAKVPYDFRHTFATRMAQGGEEGGVDLATLAALLGHDGIRVVKKYVHPTAEHKKAAMERYDRMMQKARKASKRKAKSR